MTSRGIHRLRVSRRRPVASAVVRRAQMRAAFDDLSGNLHIVRSGVVAVGLLAAARILRDAASLGSIRLMLWRIPIGRPSPAVADHVMDAIAGQCVSTERLW